ncbi:MAG: hypothetical protein CME93_08625 [Hyphomonadaceae bacterium]|nr:hypothetical protein [Hyphomonadaceae bacterium]OUX93133.1 MAG: hypothetical protein CBB77_10515 [Hyphomonas sp. TMED17]
MRALFFWHVSSDNTGSEQIDRRCPLRWTTLELRRAGYCIIGDVPGLVIGSQKLVRVRRLRRGRK